jgi:hypothetical protein
MVILRRLAMGILIEFEGSDIATFLGSDLNACLEWALATFGSDIAFWAVYFPVGFDWQGSE